MRPDAFMKFEIEMETSLFRAIQRESKGSTVEAFIIEAIEDHISRLVKGRA